jgi:hypothetical protein
VSIAAYSDRFMVAMISASATTQRHCGRVNAVNFGRTEPSSTAPATHWRTATTPAGPSTGKARAAIAAPNWTEAALPVISAMPASRPDGATSAGPPVAVPGCCPRVEVVMPGAWTRFVHAQNA